MYKFSPSNSDSFFLTINIVQAGTIRRDEPPNLVSIDRVPETRVATISMEIPTKTRTVRIIVAGIPKAGKKTVAVA